jgi:hypothetical protein
MQRKDAGRNSKEGAISILESLHDSLEDPRKSVENIQNSLEDYENA